MTKKLLVKTTGNFLIFSVLILLISAPLFYLVTDKLYIVETDETLKLHKQEFRHYRQSHFKPADVEAWNKYNRNIKILSFDGTATDMLFTEVYYNKEEDENEPYRVLHSPMEIDGKKYIYSERTNLFEMEDMVIGIAMMFLVVIVVLMTGIIWISNKISKKVWKPFYNTLDKIRHFEIDKSAAPEFITTDIAEFAELNKGITRLIRTNTAIYRNQREFIENAAHELQTPLALFQTKIDTFLQLPDISKAQSVLLESLTADVSKLNRLNKNLLLLSKIEGIHIPDKKSFAINDYLTKSLPFFVEQAKAKNLTITTEFTENLTIESDPFLAEILMNNLFLNAIAHNKADGQIVISILSDSVSFQNSGVAMALDKTKIFSRFAKLNQSGSGNGLGLSIVKKIAELYNWHIEYFFSDNLHIFTVRFKDYRPNSNLAFS